MNGQLVRLGPKRRLAGEDLVQDRPQGVDVGGWAERLLVAGRLLGGHVAGRAEHGLRARQPLVLVKAFGQAKVGDFGNCRLQIEDCRFFSRVVMAFFNLRSAISNLQ